MRLTLFLKGLEVAVQREGGQIAAGFTMCESLHFLELNLDPSSFFFFFFMMVFKLGHVNVNSSLLGYFI